MIFFTELGTDETPIEVAILLLLEESISNVRSLSLPEKFSDPPLV